MYKSCGLVPSGCTDDKTMNFHVKPADTIIHKGSIDVVHVSVINDLTSQILGVRPGALYKLGKIHVFCIYPRCTGNRLYVTYLSSHHCECFPRAGLPIGKHTSIVSFKCCLQDCPAQIIKYLQDTCSSVRVFTVLIFTMTMQSQVLHSTTNLTTPYTL